MLIYCMAIKAIFRAYVQKDRSTLLSILQRNIPRYFAQQELKDFEIFIDQNADSYKVILYESSIVGGISWFVDEKEKSATIAWIFLDPEVHNIGLGRESVDYFLRSMNKISGLVKYKVRTSQLVYKFFEKFGFTTIKIKEDYWAKGFDLYEMELMLDKE